MGDDWKSAANMAALAAFTCAVGVAQDIGSFWNQIKKPKALLSGLLTHYGLQPVYAWLFIYLFNLSKKFAVGLLIISCCPGGMFSNGFALYFEFDISLNIAMTSASSLVAITIVPFLIKTYIPPSYTDSGVSIDEDDILHDCVLILSSVLLGMSIRLLISFCVRDKEKVHHYANILEKMFAILAMMTTIGIGVAVIFGADDKDAVQSETVPFSEWLQNFTACLCVSFFGMTTALTFAYFMMGVSKASCLAIAVETGVQNFSLAQQIVLNTFENESDQAKAIEIVMLYGGTSCIVALMLGWIFWTNGWTGASPDAIRWSYVLCFEENNPSDRCQAWNWLMRCLYPCGQPNPKYWCYACCSCGSCTGSLCDQGAYHPSCLCRCTGIRNPKSFWCRAHRTNSGDPSPYCCLCRKSRLGGKNYELEFCPNLWNDCACENENNGKECDPCLVCLCCACGCGSGCVKYPQELELAEPQGSSKYILVENTNPMDF